jgi:hypothetical protein
MLDILFSLTQEQSTKEIRPSLHHWSSFLYQLVFRPDVRAHDSVTKDMGKLNIQSDESDSRS